MERLEDFKQYQQTFVYGVRQNPESRAEDQTTKTKKSDRWNQLPWYLKSKLDLRTKRLITQLRQNSVYLRVGDAVISLPHPNEKTICTVCFEQAIDSPQHTIMECPITSITAKSLKGHGWSPENFMKFLDTPWEDATTVSKLIMQPLRMRLFISTSIADMARGC